MHQCHNNLNGKLSGSHFEKYHVGRINKLLTEINKFSGYSDFKEN